MAVAVSFWHRKRADFCSSLSKRGFQAATSQHWLHGGSDPDRCSYLEKVIDQLCSLDSAVVLFSPNYITNALNSDQQLLRARQRARYLRLVRPPTLEELRKSRGKRRRDALLRKTVRCLRLFLATAPVCVWWFQMFHLFFSDCRGLLVCGSMLLLMLCINHGISFSDHYHLNKAITKGLLRSTFQISLYMSLCSSLKNRKSTSHFMFQQRSW